MLQYISVTPVDFSQNHQLSHSDALKWFRWALKGIFNILSPIPAQQWRQEGNWFPVSTTARAINHERQKSTWWPAWLLLAHRRWQGDLTIPDKQRIKKSCYNQIKIIKFYWRLVSLSFSAWFVPIRRDTGGYGKRTMVFQCSLGSMPAEQWLPNEIIICLRSTTFGKQCFRFFICCVHSTYSRLEVFSTSLSNLSPSKLCDRSNSFQPPEKRLPLAVCTFTSKSHFLRAKLPFAALDREGGRGAGEVCGKALSAMAINTLGLEGVRSFVSSFRTSGAPANAETPSSAPYNLKYRLWISATRFGWSGPGVVKWQ